MTDASHFVGRCSKCLRIGDCGDWGVIMQTNAGEKGNLSKKVEINGGETEEMRRGQQKHGGNKRRIGVQPLNRGEKGKTQKIRERKEKRRGEEKRG